MVFHYSSFNSQRQGSLPKKIISIGERKQTNNFETPVIALKVPTVVVCSAAKEDGTMDLDHVSQPLGHFILVLLAFPNSTFRC